MFLQAGLATALLTPGAVRMAKAEETYEELKQRWAAEHAKALANFPFERIVVPGAEAYATWQRLKAEKRGAPVVLGDDETAGRMTEWLAFSQGRAPDAALDKSKLLEHAQAALAAARSLRHPEDLRRMRADAEVDSDARWEQMLKDNPDAPLPTMTITNPDGTQRTLTREEFIAMVEEASGRPEPIGH